MSVKQSYFITFGQMEILLESLNIVLLFSVLSVQLFFFKWQFIIQA